MLPHKTDIEPTNPLLMVVAWLNYIFSYAFSLPVLNKIALVLSIVSSLFYIYATIKKIQNEKINKQRSS